ncbi:MAG: hypothetical protein ABI361_01005 [Nitrososphaera sp.]|jgi:hypothetical protein
MSTSSHKNRSVPAVAIRVGKHCLLEIEKSAADFLNINHGAIYDVEQKPEGILLRKHTSIQGAEPDLDYHYLE